VEVRRLLAGWIGKHTIQFLGKSVFAAYEGLSIRRYRAVLTKNLPSVAFADVWSIVVGFETFDKRPLSSRGCMKVVFG